MLIRTITANRFIKWLTVLLTYYIISTSFLWLSPYAGTLNYTFIVPTLILGSPGMTTAETLYSFPLLYEVLQAPLYYYLFSFALTGLFLTWPLLFKRSVKITITAIVLLALPSTLAVILHSSRGLFTVPWLIQILEVILLQYFFNKQP